MAKWVGARILSFGRVPKGKVTLLAASDGPVMSCVCLNAYECFGKHIIYQMLCSCVPTHRELGSDRSRTFHWLKAMAAAFAPIASWLP